MQVAGDQHIGRNQTAGKQHREVDKEVDLAAIFQLPGGQRVGQQHRTDQAEEGAEDRDEERHTVALEDLTGAEQQLVRLGRELGGIEGKAVAGQADLTGEGGRQRHDKGNQAADGKHNGDDVANNS